ncbi:hypothetical protein M407DRAFT_17145 [Tulasnella calospora MUT 4182]|uniref:HSF-type DNA-binding domain-containing protein n=1 Tax=Tulasnella calospora MUT 4182 TaxID=1051891 RepID=A0A0C3QYD0_9AGAM|nr:hypothetical protein M407DRAFT_17145 [Tulasnella calospora MUT 4182]
MSQHGDQLPLQGTRGPNSGIKLWVNAPQVAGGVSDPSFQHGGYVNPGPSAEPVQLWDQWEPGAYLGPQDEEIPFEGTPGVPGLVAGPSGTHQTLDTTVPYKSVADKQTARPGGLFPHKLYRAPKFITFNSDGTEIIIHDCVALEKSGLLSDYFGHNKARLFNFYEFTKVNRAKGGGKTHVWYHHNFFKGCEGLLGQIKPKAQSSDSPKALVAKLQNELKRLKGELSHSEARVSQLEEEKEKLEDKNKRLEKKNKRLEDKNERLEDKNEILDTENKRLEAELHNNWQTRPLRGVAPTVPSMPSRGLQAAGNGQSQAGSATGNILNHSQQSMYTAQPDCTIYQPSHPQVSSYGNVRGTPDSILPYRQPTNASMTMVSGSSGPSEVQPLSQAFTTAPVDAFYPGSPVARQSTPKGPKVVHTRNTTSVVPKQQLQNQETCNANYYWLAQILGGPSSAQ